ncbi:MAG: phenylalanine-4-hydroxylase [Arenicella sp.]|jgi:phenylalanine-4-hydroxylase
MYPKIISQDQVIDSLPVHLRPFVAYQDYQQYTARDQAVWRFLLEQLKRNLSQSAHPTYLEGLQRTGISADAIPRIEDINQCLNKLSWRAVVVDGFLPPAIFMEFQAIKVLVIAVNIRPFEHMLYTPAPDIVHESAGHAPFLIDIDYAEFLQYFGELGMRSISCKADMDVYEAVRYLSIIKETPNASASDIAEAKRKLAYATEKNPTLSESALLTRLHWWTVEYGLVGDLESYQIYGAGLLSSLGECVHCLDDDKVAKRSLTVDAINTTYDITSEQAQLFVAESCRHLSQVLEEFGRNMACNRGGTRALEQAIDAATVCTATTNSGIQISGEFTNKVVDAVGNIIYFNTTGETQLAYQDHQLSGHGTDYHRQGFGSPIGRLRGFERCLSSYTVDELKRHNIEIGGPCELSYLSGIQVTGVVTDIIRHDQKNILLTFAQCTVRDRKGEILFDPSWGSYDMAVGDAIVSVQGGTADKEAYPLYEAPSTQVILTQLYDERDEQLFYLYRSIREIRESSSGNDFDELKSISAVNQVAQSRDIDWLLTFEALELSMLAKLDSSISRKLRDNLVRMRNRSDSDTRTLIGYALERLEAPEDDNRGRWSI